MLRIKKPQPGKRYSDKLIYCKEHTQMQYCTGCETDCMFCQPIYEYRQVKKPEKKTFKMSRTRPSRIQ